MYGLGASIPDIVVIDNYDPIWREIGREMFETSPDGVIPIPIESQQRDGAWGPEIR